MGETKIEWATLGHEKGFSLNPFRARDKATGAKGHFCQKITPGCKHCYASRLQSRFNMHPYAAENRDKVEFYFDVKALEVPLKRRRPAGFFWFDMTDWCLPDYPAEWIVECLEVVAATPQHRHAWLTKRPERIQSVLYGEEGRFYLGGGDYIPHLWLGVSVEDQKTADERRPYMEALAAMGWMTFVSYEPALAMIDWTGWEFLKWLVSGGESGHRAQPSHPNYHRGAREFCQRHGIAYFFKQWGEWAPYSEVGEWLIPGHGIESVYVHTSARTSTDPFISELGEGWQQMYKIGKKRAGRLLDGRTWSEFPVGRGDK